MIGSGFLKNLISGKGSEIIESVGGVIDNFVQTKEEKDQVKIEVQKVLNQHLESMTTLANEELKLYLADTADARNMNAKIQDSDKASWLSKNIAYMIDSVFIISFIIMLVLILNKQVPEANKELFYTGFGALSAFVGNIINFHRGTSIGSERKQKQLDKLSEKN